MRRLPCVPWRLQAPGRAPGTEQSAGTVPCPGALRRSSGPSPNSLRSLRSLRSNMRRQVSLRSARRARAESPALLSVSEARHRLPACGLALRSTSAARPTQERWSTAQSGAVGWSKVEWFEPKWAPRPSRRRELGHRVQRLTFEVSRRWRPQAGSCPIDGRVMASLRLHADALRLTGDHLLLRTTLRPFQARTAACSRRHSHSFLGQPGRFRARPRRRRLCQRRD